MNGKEEYIKGLAKYHKEIEKTLKDLYQIKTQYLEVLAWGYITTSLYIKATDQDYIFRLSNYSPQKFKDLEREIFITQNLQKTIKTTEYVKDIHGRFLNVIDDKIIRVSKHIEGLPPFDMNFEIFKDIINMQKRIHQQKIDVELPQINVEKEKLKFLHGDLTPSNVLVSYGKLVAILDFELALFGPVEYDIAKTIVFCWFRDSKKDYLEYLKVGVESYNQANISLDLINIYAKQHLQTHLNNIISHKENYDVGAGWQSDYDFTNKMLDRFTTSILKIT